VRRSRNAGLGGLAGPRRHLLASTCAPRRLIPYENKQPREKKCCPCVQQQMLHVAVAVAVAVAIPVLGLSNAAVKVTASKSRYQYLVCPLSGRCRCSPASSTRTYSHIFLYIRIYIQREIGGGVGGLGSWAADWANVPEWQPLSGGGMRSAATWG